MTKNEAIEASKFLFKTYPTVNVFHFTKDGMAFGQKNNAESHAIQLDKKNPDTIEVKREEIAAKPAKEPVSAEQAEVTKLTGIVGGLEKAFAKAAAKNKPAIQKQL